MPTLSSPSPWREAWSQYGDAVYLNLAGQAPMPAASLESARTALEWKAFPQLLSDQAERDLTERVRGLLANLIGAEARQVAVTTGASAGLAVLAYGVDWKAGDEILTACREFPVQYTTWRPMEAREDVSLKLVSPAGKWITAENLIAALTPRTRVVSVSLVRFDDGSLLDAAKLSAACRARGVVVALDVSQACGAIPMDVRTLGADFLTCSGYKWLLGPYGTGFFWISPELQARFRPTPFYWQGIAGLRDFSDLAHEKPKPAQGARGWDAAETASPFNLAGWETSLKFLLKIGIETVTTHTRQLMEQLRESLPQDRCLWTSPPEPERRGPLGCFSARNLGETRSMYERLRAAKIFPSLRETSIRVSTHLYTTPDDIAKLVRVISE